MHVRKFLYSVIASSVLLSPSIALSQESTGDLQEFYKGETIRIVHGFGPGGGFDTSARVVAMHLPKHIPGNPEVVVESMTGAGSLLATNYIFSKAKPDGLTLGYIESNVLVQELLERPGVGFKSSEFEWLGSPSYTTPICLTMKASGINTIDDWRDAKTPVKMGTQGLAGTSHHDLVRLLSTGADLPTQVVVGHKGGNPDLKLASERGEIAGFCGGLDATSNLFGPLPNENVNVLVQFGEQPDPLIPNVPLAKDVIKRDEVRHLLRIAVSNPAQMTRVFVFPPETPEGKVQMMRMALSETFKDPAFLKDAKKAGVAVNPVSGEKTAQLAAEMSDLPSEDLAKLKEILMSR